jgi:hypothetical protein
MSIINRFAAAATVAAATLLPLLASADTVCRKECTENVCREVCVEVETQGRSDRREQRQELREERRDERRDERRREPGIELRVPGVQLEIGR